MPRAKKQPIQTAAGQAYGVAGEQKQSMQSMPLPATEFSGGTVPGAQPAQPGGAPAASPSGAPPVLDPMAAALQAASATMPPATGLDAPSARPNEPVTAGVPVGPGPGLGALSMLQPGPHRPTPVADNLEVIARANGSNPALAELAARARAKGV